MAEIRGGLSRRSFLVGSVAAAGVAGVGRTGAASASPPAAAANAGAPVGTSTPGPDRLAIARVPEYPIDRAERPAVRGHRGLAKAAPSAPFGLRLMVAGVGSSVVGLSDLGRFERVEQVTELRGRHGTAVVHWTGVRLGDVLRWVTSAEMVAELRSSGLAMNAVTPDGSHRVTIPIDAAVHPQTLLATHLGGLPLDVDHGAPLRLVVPVRPASDSLKRVGRIEFRR